MGLLRKMLRILHPVRTTKRAVKRALIPRPVRSALRAKNIVVHPLGSMEAAVKNAAIGAIDKAVTPRPKRSTKQPSAPLRATFHGVAPANTPADWDRSGLWRQWPAPEDAIRGESRRQAAIAALAGPIEDDGCYQPVSVTLVREPENPADALACRAEVQGHMVGYLAHERAQHLAPLVDAARTDRWSVAGVITGGFGNAPHFGVHLWLDHRLTPGPGWPV